MEKPTISEIESQIEKCIAFGKYPVVTKKIIESAWSYTPSQKVLDSKEILLEEYNNYIEMLLTLPKNILEAFLSVMKNYDIKDNQRLEYERGFILDITEKLKEKNTKHAIDYILEHSNSPLTQEKLQKTHGLLMEGTRNFSAKDYFFRKHNTKIVGTVVNGEREIYYIPPKASEIPELAQLFLEYYNNEDLNKEIFTSPIMNHGLLASIQIFDDGNTRLARLLQHAKLYRQTNKLLGYDFKSPIIYSTKTYYPERNTYRARTIQIVKDPNNQAFDDWNIFNHKHFLSQIYKNEERIKQLKKLKNI